MESRQFSLTVLAIVVIRPPIRFLSASALIIVDRMGIDE